MDPQLLDHLTNIGYQPGVFARLSEVTDFVGLSCRLTLLCSTLGLAGSDLTGDSASHRLIVSEHSRLTERTPDANIELYRPVLSDDAHPLAQVYRFAMSRYDYVRPRIKDYECMVVKRERIEGVLSDYQHVHMKVRSQQMRDGRVVVPYSVFARWLAPADIVDRKLLFVAGWNDGKVRVRKGGGRFSYVKLNLSPFGESAQRESHHPITEVGFVRVAYRLVNQIADDIRLDPQGENTQARFFKDAKVSGRVCTRIEVIHPSPWPGVIFHKANLFIDNQRHVPIRIEIYDWPEGEDGAPQLTEEYTYLKVRLNVGLNDSDFAPTQLN